VSNFFDTGRHVKQFSNHSFAGSRLPLFTLPRIHIHHRRRALLALALTVLCCAPFGAAATTVAALQMQLGNPSDATADTNNHNHFLIVREVEALDYNDSMGQPNWASWDLTSSDIGSSGRSSNFFTDTNLPPNFFWVPGDPINPFSGSGYDRGHMCPSGDRTSSPETNDLVFYMSNIIPQASAQNQGIWANFESYCRSLLSTSEVLIVCGPSQFTTNKLYSNHVTIPGYTWKIVVVAPLGGGMATNRITANTRVIGINVPNTGAVGSDPWQNYITSVNQIQNDTGFTFFTALAPNLASVLRSKVDGQAAPAPVISGFSPTSGNPGLLVSISGTNLNFTTNVTFNGFSAPFTINSPTNLTATVPANATSGLITVKSLGGTVNSSGSFTVTTATNADLAINASHTGAFTQGDLGDVISLIVTNVGAAAATGLVTISNTLPAGLVATALDGAGWTTDLSTLTCNRSDSLGPNATYPAIVITVNVLSNAPAAVTNFATLSNPNETNLLNNSSSDAITINPASAPVVVTSSASNINATTVTLTGNVNPDGQPATVQFEYGPTTNYGSLIAAGTFTGTNAQALSAGVTNLSASTTYHFRAVASNVLGSAFGLDQTFTTTTLATPDLAITLSHPGIFTQGDIGDTYVISITNVGPAASSGTITVSNSLPAGLTATSIGGSGWTTDLATLTGTRSDVLAGGAGYPPITLKVNVSLNAPAIVTNRATVFGAGDANPANDSAADPTTINPTTNRSILAGWDTSSLPGGANNYGPSPLAPTTNAPNVTAIGLTRGVGVGTANTGAARGWGGSGWTNSTSVAAIGSNQFLTFGLAANAGFQLSFAAISRFDYRRSNTGPTNGLLQYQLGSGPFVDIATLSYPSNSSTGASLDPINLSTLSALQNIGPGTNVTFRVVNWGGGSAGTWYVFDTASNTAPDLVIQGTVSPILTPIEAWRFQYFGITNNSGVAADTAVNSSDGMPNLLKYALGLNPLVPTPNPVVGDITTGYLRLTLPKNPNATDITYFVQVTSDIVAGPWTTAGTVLDENTPTLLQVHDSAAVPASTQRFIRLEVTRP
jgi:DNA/RNA endonuclease G (NUC1)